jgi:hypothetical protein
LPGEILFLTSTNLACNPRCLKEVRLLASTDVRITVLAFHLHNWTTEKEKELNSELKNVLFHYLDSGRHPLLPWLWASFLEKTCRLIRKLAPSNIRVGAIALHKRSWSMLHWVKKNKKKYDLVIAHNPPAFLSASWLASKTGSAFALDIEDYHPGEGRDPAEQQGAMLLMRRLQEKAAYVSYASPLIKEYSRRLIANTGEGSYFVVNNTFPRTDFKRPAPEPAPGGAEGRLRLVWFSQFIDYGRGLEKILPSLDQFSESIQLTLIGSMRPEFHDRELADRTYIDCRDALAERELHLTLGDYDIGLALEDVSVDLNRNLCLTNKIWSYLLAGLFIVASDTEAQRRFLEDFPGHGVCSALSADRFVSTVAACVADRTAIREGSVRRFDAAATASWENESLLLLQQWKKTIGQPAGT